MPSFGGRVAIVGTGHRCRLYIQAVAARPASAIVALCDPNVVRMEYVNGLLQSLGEPAAKQYPIVSSHPSCFCFETERTEIASSDFAGGLRAHAQAGEGRGSRGNDHRRLSR